MLRNSKRSIDRVSPVLKRKKMTFISEILEPPTKSQSDKKEYRLIKLPNGMKSLLIQHFLPEKDEDDSELSQKSREINDKSDPESSQESSQSSGNEEESEGEDESSGEKLAAVALCINAGSFSDPVEVQGLFHFLEHMIFMGSAKFPKENDYDQFISNNGGFNNAHTECEYTLYQFEIVDDELEKALDIFAQLFISPLMLKDSIQREAEAVESEFQQNLIDDDVRIQQFYASLANGPASIFTWGNQATLTGKISNDKLYEMVHEYRKKFYLANKMFLCVESALGLDELQTLIESKFNAIQRGPEPVPYEIPTEHFKPEFFNKMYFVKPKADKIKLYLTFQLPSMQNHYRSKPHDYVSFILQHEGVGSLTSYLKKRLYILSIEAGSSDQSYEGNSLYSLFSIEVLLTTAGEKNLDEVLKAIFSCLLMLKITSDGDHRKVFEEVRSLKETQFKYVEEKSPTDNAENLAVNMHYFDSKDIITGTDLYLDYDPIMIRKVIEIINEPKFNLLLLTEKDSQTFDKTEKWFGTKYKEIDYPESYKKLWENRTLLDELSMPQPNDFICTNFDIICDKEDQSTLLPQIPQKILENEIVECYHKLDNIFKLPHAIIYFYMVSPLTIESIKGSVMTSLFSMIAKYYMEEELYPATCAGLGCSIYSAEKGLLMKFTGFNEKLPLLLELVTSNLTKIVGKVSEEVFDTYKAQFKKNGHNLLIKSSSFNKDLRLEVVEEHHKFAFYRYLEVERITLDEFKIFCGDFLKHLKIQFLFQGNISKGISLSSTTKVLANLGCEKIPDNVTIDSRARKIPIGQNILSVRSLLNNDKNSKLINFVQLGLSSIKLQSLIEFVEKLMEEPSFDILRTKAQLGYSVGVSHRFNHGILGLTVDVQSQESKHSIQEVYDKVEEFINIQMPEILEKLTDEEFESNKQALIKLKKIIDNDLETEANRHWGEITSREYIFNRLQLEAETISQLTKNEVIQFYKDHVIAENARKLSVQVVGYPNAVEELETSEENDSRINQIEILDSTIAGNKIRNIEEFKNSLEFYPITKTSIK